MSPRILVVGGAGAFGRRLVEGLLATTQASVIVAGRFPHRHEDLIHALKERYGPHRVEATALDRDRALDTLRDLKPFCVVDAAGPFQNAEPHLARAAIAAGCHCVDLADARDFVARFGSLDADAREAGVLAATGASSTPALSGAAVAALTEGWQGVERIDIVISPGNRAPRGLSVIEAILSYAGQPVRVLACGRWTTEPGWGAPVRRNMPGLGPRWLSLCETPDLDLLPARYPAARTVRFRAGLELSILHLGLWLLTFAVRFRLIRSLRPLAAALRGAAAWFERFGTDRGGMSVEVLGADREGRATRAVWSLTAEAGDGPNIPVLPALALVRGLLQGQVTATGARVAGDLLPLAAIEREFGRFRITVRREVGWPQASGLFERVLGPDFALMPPLVRRVHGGDSIRLSGRAAIEGAGRPAGRWIARLFGFPGGSPDEPAGVLLKRRGDREVWTRRFGRSSFRSTLHPGPSPRRLCERFGPFTFELEIAAHADGFTLAVVGWRMGFVRLPASLAPRSPARAFLDGDGRYGFDVAIALPWIGPLVRYRGWLLPDEP